jgi:hypothetical protein
MSYGWGRTADGWERDGSAMLGMRVQRGVMPSGLRRRSTSKGDTSKVEQARCMHEGKTTRRTTMVSLSPSPVHSARRP